MIFVLPALFYLKASAAPDSGCFGLGTADAKARAGNAAEAAQANAEGLDAAAAAAAGGTSAVPSAETACRRNGAWALLFAGSVMIPMCVVLWVLKTAKIWPTAP